MPCASPWSWRIRSPGQYWLEPLCPEACQKHHAFQSGAYGEKEFSLDQQKSVQAIDTNSQSPPSTTTNKKKTVSPHQRFYTPVILIFFTKKMVQTRTDLSAPAHDNILLILSTWKGWTRMRMWNWSFPQFLTIYLLAQMRAASRASLDSCSYSSETRWTQRGNWSTGVFFAPKS